jgi:1-acyl-sn-glycerol-3-phosphate acyltransferase
MKRETLQAICRFLLTRLARVEFCGLEHLPSDGAIIVATNHMSRMDTLYLFINPARPDITALVADKYKKYPIFNWILDVGGIIWLDRSKADFGAFRLAADVLKNGVSLGIAPEGTRSTTGQLIEGKQGTALLALKAGVPIVPVGIAGSEVYFRRLLTLRRPNLRLTFGPPIHLPPLDRNNREESLQKMTDEIMCRIAILLPPQYWGFYRDHPRLKEMLANPEAYR